MSTPLTPLWKFSLIAAISRLRQQWKDAAELRNCGEEAVEQMAHEVGLTALELCQLASKGSHAADPLVHRMKALDLEAREIGKLEPMVLRDMERVCSMCESHSRCFRDLARNVNDPIWKRYCPNAATLESLDALPWASRLEI